MVTDIRGESLPHADIGVRSVDGERFYEADEQGRFTISDLSAGVYDVRVWSEGFASARWDLLTLSDGEHVKLQVALQVGSVGDPEPIRRGLRAIPGNPLRWPAALGRWIRRKLH